MAEFGKWSGPLYGSSGSMKCNKTDTSKSYGWIVITFSANDLNGTRNKWLYFWSDLDHCLDHLDPGCNIILGWILMIFLGYVTNGKGKKW